MGRHSPRRRHHYKRSRSRDHDRSRRRDYSRDRSRSHSRDMRSKKVEQSANTIKISHPRELDTLKDSNLTRVASGKLPEFLNSIIGV